MYKSINVYNISSSTTTKHLSSTLNISHTPLVWLPLYTSINSLPLCILFNCIYVNAYEMPSMDMCTKSFKLQYIQAMH